jgi:outer membrane lipoprotein-sorting protein
MHKIILTLLLLLTIALAGCTQVEVDNSTNSDDAKEDTKFEDKSVDSKLVSLLSKKDDVPNLVYEYSRPPLDPKIYIYHINGNKGKIVMPKFNLYPKGEPYFDTIYFGLNSKTARGYCEFRDICGVKKVDPNEEVELPFAKYYQKNPYDWLKDIPLTAEIVGSEQIETRSTTVVKYKDAGVEKKIWIDEFYGLPLRVEFKSPLEEYAHTFKIKDIGRVQMENLEHVQQKGLRR